MILSQSVIYSLRVAAFLGIQTKGSRFSSEHVSRETKIPKHYCSKILKKLVDAGIISSIRGPGGGFSVCKNPKKIRFLDLVQTISPNLSTKECVFGFKRCGDEDPCPLHYRWKEFRSFFERWTAETTLQEIVEDQHKHKLMR